MKDVYKVATSSINRTQSSRLSETLALRPVCVSALWVKDLTVYIEPDQKSMEIIFERERAGWMTVGKYYTANH